MSGRIAAAAGVMLMALPCGLAPLRAPASARLELRIVAQSGTPGAPCVYNDPPTPAGSADPPREAWCSANVARRFEVQYRLVDGGDPPPPPGAAGAPLSLRTARIGVTASSATAGLWGRAVLSVREGEGTAAELREPPGRVDCTGLPIAPPSRPRGLHAPFRSLLTGTDPSEDADNGSFQPAGITGIQPLAAGPVIGAEPDGWFGLYSFEFTPSAGLGGSVTLTAAVASSAFEYFDRSGGVRTASAVSAGTMTVRVPAAAVGCCRPLICYIALTPSACFAAGGFVATGGVCGAAATENCCFADFNRDGQVGVQDLLDFLVAYQSGSSDADFNRNGVLSIQDVFDFLAAYFAGCP